MQTLFEKLAKCQTSGEVERMLAGTGFGEQIYIAICERLPWGVRGPKAVFQPEIKLAIRGGIDAAIKAGKD